MQTVGLSCYQTLFENIDALLQYLYQTETSISRSFDMITDIIGISGTHTIIREGCTIASYPEIHVRNFVRSLPLRTVLLVTGGASGVDQVAEDEARKRGMATATIPYYSELGKSGGFARNIDLVDFVHRLVAFWNLKSGGTKHAIEYAKKKGKLEKVYGPDGTIIF